MILKNIFRTGFLVLCLALLSACSGGGSGEAQALKLYEEKDFSIQVDPSWRVVTSSEFYAEVPKETLVAFSAPESLDGFFINLNISKEVLKQNVTPADYGRANINVSGQNLTDYKKVQEVVLDLDGKPALLHIFQARLNPNESLLRFIQLYTAKANQGYIVSAGVPVDTPENTRNLVGSMVTSFRLK